MSANTKPAIVRLVEHHRGLAAFSRVLGGRPAYQEIQRWVGRGWASPKYLIELEPHLIDGMTLRDLIEDRAAAARRASALAEAA